MIPNYTDEDFREMVLDHFVASPYVDEGMVDGDLLERYHRVLSAMLDGYRWGDRLTDAKDFPTVFYELDVPAWRDRHMHRYIGIFMGGTLFHDVDDSGEYLYFTINDIDGSQQGKVAAARISDPDEDGQRQLLLDVNAVLSCPLKEEEE